MVERRKVIVWGAVQGVGFRPFAYALAQEEGIGGFVINTSQGAELEIEGRRDVLDRFLARLCAELPLPGVVLGLKSTVIPPLGDTAFTIRMSQDGGTKSALVLPDLTPCLKCLAEILDPSDRRFGYAFTNCTHCGPRYSIIRSLPYDRPNTSMASFPLCDACRGEYENPLDRRFHAQPTACPVCGPKLELWDSSGQPLCLSEDSLQQAVLLLSKGAILALKGVGGFHLMVDARCEESVLALRARKRREYKPLAVMALDLEMARGLADLSDSEEALLASAAAPIVIARSKQKLAPAVAPENPNIGIMLPSSPLHHLLMRAVGFPLVATSGNLSDEPLCIDSHEAVERLGGIADAFLVHDRPIIRPIDDSICRTLGEGVAVLRRARGFAPLPFPLAGAEPGIAAYGSHLKGSVAVTGEGKVVVGQHIGDLDNRLARLRLEEEVRDLCAIQGTEVSLAVHDLHPDYGSTLLAQSLGVEALAVQHHLAHALSLMGEHESQGPFLAIVWDGTGLGLDGAIWGGEFILINDGQASRVGHLRPFLLAGGDAAAKQGWRSALGLIAEMEGAEGLDAVSFGRTQEDQVKAMLIKQVGCSKTTSAGRLFDGAAAIGAGIIESRFEGDAAMRWECLASESCCEPYPIGVCEVNDGLELDWRQTISALKGDESEPSVKSARFHAALADGMAEIAARVGVEQIGLTGGCFQNQLLSRLTCEALRRRGLVPVEHREIPPNDGGIALGQAVAAARRITWSEP